jgi:hypothetical protein
LSDTEKKQQKLTEYDPLKTKIEDLFHGKVGSAPKNQNEVDEIYKDGEIRYSNLVPPGYSDSNKDKDEIGRHCFGGIIYNRKFGDYLIWHQIIQHVKDKGISTVVFVTDDAKEDWWWKINSGGEKTLGPRPELIEEIRRLGNVEKFFMYKPEGFLSYSKDHLKANVSPETLDEVRDVSRFQAHYVSDAPDLATNEMQAKKMVHSWLSERFGLLKRNTGSFPDFLARKNGKQIGFEVSYVRSPSRLRNMFMRTSWKFLEHVRNDNFERLVHIWVFPIEEMAHASYPLFRNRVWKRPIPRVQHLIGYLNEEDGQFVALYDMRPDAASSDGEFEVI